MLFSSEIRSFQYESFFYLLTDYYLVSKPACGISLLTLYFECKSTLHAHSLHTCFLFLIVAYGRGIYFYVDASSAQRRCDVNTSRQKVMFLGRAETGTFTVGRKGINVAPPVDPFNPGILYHSVVDNKENPTVFVVFSSDRTYPEYCITFSD